VMIGGRYHWVRGTAMTTERIEINPAVMMGKPVIRGTRITVELILHKLAEGATEAEMLEDYPHLTPEGYPGGDRLWSGDRGTRGSGAAL
jgi:uncharacterized protein (DUF433 family)